VLARAVAENERLGGGMRGWSGWINLGGDLASAPAVVSTAPNHLEVFVQGADNHLVWRRWDGSGWSGWINLGGDIAGPPAVTSLGPSSLEVFVRGVHDNDLVWRRFPQSLGRWVSIGPTRITTGAGPSRNAVGRVTTVAIHPQSPSTIYVGCRGSGVWKTDDSGSSWRPIADALPTLTIQAIAIDPSAPSRVYVVTPAGVFQSTDSGANWMKIYPGNLNGVFNGGALLVDRSAPATLYVTSTDGVYRSTTSGTSWDLVLSGGQSGSLVIDPTAHERLHAALHATDPTRTGIYESTDSGATWRKLTGCPGGRLPTVTEDKTGVKFARSGNRLFASFKTPSSWTLYRTTGVGCSIGGHLELMWEPMWSPTGSIGDDPIHSRLWSWLHADAVDANVVYAGGTDVWVSRDGGASFSRSQGPHADHHAFAINPLNPKIVYTGCDGGLYRSSDRAKQDSWAFCSDGLANVELYDLASTATNPDMVIGGTQDNSLIRRLGTSTRWDRVDVGTDWPGDIEAVVIDPSNDRIFYAVHQFMNQMNRSADGGNHWPAIGDGLDGGCDIWQAEYPSTPLNHLIIHPAKPTVLLATCGSLWKGLPWQRLAIAGAGTIARAAVDPTVDLYYAGTAGGTVYAGPGGTAWRSVFTHPNHQRVRDLKVDPDQPSVIYAAFDGSGAGRVYRLRRTSATPTSMDSLPIDSGLPTELSIYRLAIDAMTPLTIYAGTSAGVYRGKFLPAQQQWSWEPYNLGLPRADVRSLEVHRLTGVLRAGTFGRGAYEVLPAAIRTKSST
jgi:hypothetical protein